jgi:hypothetical protein
VVDNQVADNLAVADLAVVSGIRAAVADNLAAALPSVASDNQTVVNNLVVAGLAAVTDIPAEVWDIPSAVLDSVVSDIPEAALPSAASDNQVEVDSLAVEADSLVVDSDSLAVAVVANILVAFEVVAVDRPAACTPKASRAVRIFRQNLRLWGSGCIR